MSANDRFDYRQIDDILHSRIRLAVVSVLARCEEAEFTYIRDTVGATDGNLTTHCKKLEESGYISVDKRFVERKPATFYRLTQQGRDALVQYARHLADLIQTEGEKV
jgi:DNA-binding MarR family transcriptional regulator